MLLLRLSRSSQPLFQRTLVTQTQVSVFNDNKNDKINEYESSNGSWDPPRQPLTQQFTHQVTNQVPPLEYIDLFKSDLTLCAFLNKERQGKIRDMGVELGTFHWFEEGQLANRYSPVLQQFDRYGQRIDEVQFHPAYHNLMRIGMRYGVSYDRKKK